MAKIAWFIPTLIEGSGGHRTILQHAAHLETCGHNCHIYLEDTFGIEEPKKRIKNLFGFDFSNVTYGWNNSTDAEIAIATIWYSAIFVRDLPFECKKVYFVQDYEAYFNPMGDSYLLAENSYNYGLIPVTIGRWLRYELKNRFDVKGYNFEFGANIKIYKPITVDKNREKAVCFIYQPEKPRRCSQLGLEALGILKYKMPEVKIYLYGSSSKGNIWFEHENLGLLGLSECNELYNKCHVGLCISASNPSRIPFEMMSSGLPVVEIWRENNLYDFPEEAVLLCQQDAESLAQGMMDILNNPVKASAMSTAGSMYMSGHSLDLELEQFSNSITSILINKKLSDEMIERLYNIPPIKGATAVNPNILNATQHIISRKHQKLRTIAAMLPPVIRKVLKVVYLVFNNK